MNIAIFNIYSGMVARGAETVVDQLAKFLTKRHQVTVYQGGNPTKATYKQIQVTGIEPLPTDPGKNLFAKAQHALYQDAYNFQVTQFTQEALRHMDTSTTHVVAFNGVNQIRSLKQYQQDHPLKIIYSNQGQFHPSIFKLAGYDNLQKLKAGPDIFISLTQPMHQWALKHAPQSVHCVCIPNGVDLQEFHPGTTPIEIDLPKPLILCVAGLQPYKQVDLLIKAVAKIPNASLIILGGGPLKYELTNLADELIPNRYLITNVPHKEISRYYAAAKVFTLPSQPLEAFGVAYLEALATNTPVVAPDDEIRKFIIGEAGLYVDVHDTEKYADAILQASRQDWNDIPQNQAQKYSWEAIGQQYEQLL